MSLILRYTVNETQGALTGTTNRLIEDLTRVLLDSFPEDHPLRDLRALFSLEQQRAVLKEANELLNVHFVVFRSPPAQDFNPSLYPPSGAPSSP